MSEVDYQLALLLQHQFEQELKRPKNYASDLQLARSLQEQFQREADIEKPGQDLVYDTKHKNKNSSKCLTDPSWEVIDPTPDIHILFMAFNERFFWNKLLAVCVSWSKHMTTCAGVCSYQGIGGMCSITLSEPLLKLRPRKDLVETLLHEMIHAYLFVTHNNTDRDAHGPEFHKHMHRINQEAGTNITVYHDFHDEVRLYQQHWWRCNGPCQNWKPYFGTVCRAKNRAPGPSDRWWAEHSRNCGGNFIKVKEPDKSEKKRKKSAEKVKSKSTAVIIHSPNSNENGNFKISTVITSKVNGIFGFKDLNTGQNSNNFGKHGQGIIKNNNNTVVINKKPNVAAKDKSSVQKIVTPVNSCVTGLGQILSDSSVDKGDNPNYLIVRNHWANKFSNNNEDINGGKRKILQESQNVKNKIPKLSVTDQPHNIISNVSNYETQCPVCEKKMTLIDLNPHLDNCLQTSDEDKVKECIICVAKVSINNYEKHVIKCLKDNSDDVFEVPEETDFIKCTCGKSIPNTDFSTHILICTNDLSNNSKKLETSLIDLTSDDLLEKQCEICKKIVSVTNYDSHAEKCLLEMYDNLEAIGGKNEERVDCLVCGKNILKCDLNSHLEDCLSLSKVFENENEPTEENIDSTSEKENKYNCPFCFNLILEKEMKSHIDYCLNVVASSSREDKTVLTELTTTLSNEDF